MLTICEDRMCAGCMACVDACPVGAVSIESRVDYYQPTIDQSLCVDCGRCRAVCQQLHPAEASSPLSWFQGWACSNDDRAASSSGGLAYSIAKAFAMTGGIVCACTFNNGEFCFKMTADSCDMAQFRGSKYVKSNPEGSYRKVKKLLLEGKKILFIGLPCQVSAMRNFIGDHLGGGLYTIDLICHGTPSPELLKMFLGEHGFKLDDLKQISFRNKSSFQVQCGGVSISEAGVLDRYLVAFLLGLSYTENCYSCPYAKGERVSDLTLGDSWGSKLVDEAGKGISLILCQSKKGEDLLKNADLKLFDVDVDCAMANNDQLRKPATSPRSRARFLKLISRGSSFERAVGLSLPKQCIKQTIKHIFVSLGILKQRGGVPDNSFS